MRQISLSDVPEQLCESNAFYRRLARKLDRFGRSDVEKACQRLADCADVQMTLREYITATACVTVAMQEVPRIGTIFSNPHSYRGMAKHIAFEPVRGEFWPAKLMDVAVFCLDTTFCCYKGGCVTFDEDTPCWIAAWGELGLPMTYRNFCITLGLRFALQYVH